MQKASFFVPALCMILKKIHPDIKVRMTFRFHLFRQSSISTDIPPSNPVNVLEYETIPVRFGARSRAVAVVFSAPRAFSATRGLESRNCI